MKDKITIIFDVLDDLRRYSLWLDKYDNVENKDGFSYLTYNLDNLKGLLEEVLVKDDKKV